MAGKLKEREKQEASAVSAPKTGQSNIKCKKIELPVFMPKKIELPVFMPKKIELPVFKPKKIKPLMFKSCGLVEVGLGEKKEEATAVDTFDPPTLMIRSGGKQQGISKIK